MKSILDVNFAGKKVLIRCDFNVPLDKSFNITDDTRIVESLPTIRKMLQDGAAVILMSHLGRPKEVGYEADFSLAPVAAYLCKALSSDVKFIPEAIGEKSLETAKALKPGEVMLLDNLRFLPGEQKGDVEYAKMLASMGDVYVNDAFGTAHRAHASTAVMAQFFPKDKYFGLLLENEIKNLDRLLKNAERPFTAIIGGSKISSKIDIIKNLIAHVDHLIIGGGMSYTFVKATGGKIGTSICEDDKLNLALEIMEMTKAKGVKLHLAVDTVATEKFEDCPTKEILNIREIPDNRMGLDIGPETCDIFKDVTLKSRTILWNGPMGVFEFENFRQGTKTIAQAVAEATAKGAFSAIGGGDSIAAINMFQLADQMSYISTGGGAMLEYLEGKTLPGIKAILD